MSGPVRVHPDADDIPDSLREREQWIAWRVEQRDGEPTKLPIDPSTGAMASSTDPDTWGTFEEALSFYQDSQAAGLGYVFCNPPDRDSDAYEDLTEEKQALADKRRPHTGPFVGVDLDGCRDPETDSVESWAKEIVTRLESYTEVSPSGTGIHVLVRAEVPPDGNRSGEVEIYDDARFFTVTGDHLSLTPGTVEDRQDALEAVHAEHVADDGPEESGSVDANPGETPEGYEGSDAELIEKAKNAKNGDKFASLWAGDTSGYPSHSEADLALCDLLAFWTGGDRQRIDDLFRRSGLYREKWDREDYKRRTIDKALDGRTDYYDPSTKGEAGPTETAAIADGGHGTWGEVVQLFESDENGSTTKGYNRAADLVCEEHDFAKVRESDELYHYVPDLGYYVRKGETYLEEILNEKLGDHANANRRREIRERVEGESYVSNDDFHPPEGKVNVENGVLDLDARELEEHSPEYYFTSQVRAKWPTDDDVDPRAEAWWLRALEDGHDKDAERKKIEEFIGYCLETWHHEREKNLFLVGPPLSGKSTIQEAIEALFGSQPTVSNLTPQQIADTQFDAAALREAALNTVNDINATPIKDTGTLKRVFSGERMKLENKFKDPHFAAPSAKHLFTANWLPRLVGQDDAVYRRLLLVEFTNTIDESDKDPRYKKRLKSDAVRQVILTRAVDARERLQEQGGFTNDRSLDKTRKLWDSWRDGHKRFLYTQFEISGEPDDEVDREAYWRAYREFATRKGYELMSNVAITKALQFVPEVYASGSGDTYGGLKWNDIDAATADTSTFGEGVDPDTDTESEQSFLDQHTAVNRVEDVVDRLSAEGDNGTVPVDDVVDALEGELGGRNPERLIEKGKQEGTFYEPEDGRIRPT